MTLVIDPALRGLIPPLSPEERAQLTANLRAEGCRDALVVWETDGLRILLDGHNRYDVCCAEGLSFPVIAAPQVTTHEEAVAWIINNQLGRRNLTPEQVSYLRGKRYNLEKKDEGRPEKLRHTDGVSGETADRLAHEFKVSARTIERDGQFAGAVDILAEVAGEERRPEILSGGPDLSRHEVVALGRLAETDPEQARERYRRATEGEALTVEPEIMEDGRKPGRSFRGRRRAFNTLWYLGQYMKEIENAPSVEQVREWGTTIQAAALTAEYGAAGE